MLEHRPSQDWMLCFEEQVCNVSWPQGWLFKDDGEVVLGSGYLVLHVIYFNAIRFFRFRSFIQSALIEIA